MRKNAGIAAAAGRGAGTAANGAADADAQQSSAPAAAADDPEAVSACPFCGAAGGVAELECAQCMNVIPYCIVTGTRMRLGDWTQCPNCEFSAHDLANYKTRKRAALAQLAEMISQSKKTEQVLRARLEHDEALRKG